MLIDYLTFSAPAPVAERLMDRMPGAWQRKQSLSVIYAEVRHLGGVSVSLPARPGGLARVNITGGGCRELEDQAGITDWQALLSDLLNADAKFSRIDCAIDDRAGLLDLGLIIAACEQGRVVSAWDSADPRPKLNPGTGQITGRGVTFGERESLTYLRIYDKSLQRGVPGHWIRVEVEAKKARAQSLARAIAKQGAMVVHSVLLGLVDFKVRPARNGRNRSQTETWWTRFLGTTARCRLEIAPRNVSQENTYRWLVRSVSPSLARLYDAGMGEQLIKDLLTAGRQRVNRKLPSMTEPPKSQITTKTGPTNGAECDP